MKVRTFSIGILVLLSACAKEIPKATPGESSPLQTIASNEIPDGARSLEVRDHTGALGTVSDVDLKNFENPGTLPYPHARTKGVFVGVSHPVRPEASLSLKDGSKISYSKKSNELLRAIHVVPPRDAIRGVKRFVLKLKDLTVYAPGTMEQDAMLSGQTICLLDNQACIGTEETKGQIVPIFANTATFSKKEFAVLKDFTRSHEIEAPKSEDGSGSSAPAQSASKERILVRPGELEIDLLAQFSLQGSDQAAQAIDFVFKSSAQYSTFDHYRKFRLALGDRIFAASGSIEIEFDVDAAKIPADWFQQNILPQNGAGDQILSPEKEQKESEAGVEEIQSTAPVEEASKE